MAVLVSMTASKESQKGVTLLEVMLVLAIASMLVVLGIKQYQTYRRDADLAQLRYTVNQVFQAMRRYYYANCQTNFTYSAVAVQPVAIALADLQTSGYLMDVLAINPYIGSGTSMANAFVLQFNAITHSRSQVLSNFTTVKIGTVVNWQAQVAVMLNTTSLSAKAIQAATGADCLSTLSGSTVTPCPANGLGTGTYAVWARMPAFAYLDARSVSPVWVSRPRIQQFIQMYTTMPITYLTSGPPGSTTQYFYDCGNAP